MTRFRHESHYEIAFSAFFEVPESSLQLQERLIELKSLPDTFEVKTTVQSTEDPRSFIFGLGRKGKTPSLLLNFYDYPGEYHLQGSPAENRKGHLD